MRIQLQDKSGRNIYPETTLENISFSDNTPLMSFVGNQILETRNKNIIGAIKELQMLEREMFRGDRVTAYVGNVRNNDNYRFALDENNYWCAPQLDTNEYVVARINCNNPTLSEQTFKIKYIALGVDSYFLIGNYNTSVNDSYKQKIFLSNDSSLKEISLVIPKGASYFYIKFVKGTTLASETFKFFIDISVPATNDDIISSNNILTPSGMSELEKVDIVINSYGETVAVNAPSGKYFGPHTKFNVSYASTALLPEFNYYYSSPYSDHVDNFTSSMTPKAYDNIFIQNVTSLNSTYNFVSTFNYDTNFVFPVCERVCANAFINCDNLRTISFPVCSRIDSSAFENCSNLKSIFAPECRYIDNSAFEDCITLEGVNLDSCTYFGSRAFCNTAIKELNATSCELVGREAFADCFNLKEINLPVCSTISSGAFSNCSILNRIGILNIENIEDYAFAYCSNITDAVAYSCTSLGSYAFTECTNLFRIEFPVLSTINTTFNDCRALTSISFPTCTRIKQNAFYGCRNLKSVYLTGSSVCTLDNINAFMDTPIDDPEIFGYLGSIYVPASLVSQYKSATNWAYYQNRFVGV